MGWRVRDARLALDGNPNQAEVAARLGWKQQKVSRIERGVTERLTAEDLDALAAVLAEDPYYIFTGKRAQAVGNLAAQIDRMELDHWGEDAVLETARREARRVQEQRDSDAGQAAEATAVVEKLVALGVDPALVERALQETAQRPPRPDGSPGDSDPEERDVLRRGQTR